MEGGGVVKLTRTFFECLSQLNGSKNGAKISGDSLKVFLKQNYDAL